MSTVIVHLATAVICWANHCYPALVGPKTVEGQFQLQLRKTELPGYGGSVLAFAEDSDGVYAIHRVWLLQPKQHRLWRLTQGSAEDRRFITNGCINVMPDVYDKLVDCCSVSKVLIEQ